MSFHTKQTIFNSEVVLPMDITRDIRLITLW